MYGLTFSRIIRVPLWLLAKLAVLFLLQPHSAQAHGEDYWNDFVIDNKNDQVETSIERVTKVLGDVARSRRPVTTWPDREIRSLQIDLEAMQEEIEAMLIHLKDEDGIYIQLASALRDNPQAGRSVAGAHALEMAIELLDYVSSLEDQQTFIDEFREDGMSVYMIDLMDAYADTMGVYKSLQQSQRRLIEVNTAFTERTAMADFRFHLRRLLIWLGLGGWAASLGDDTPSATQPADQVPTPAEMTPVAR